MEALICKVNSFLAIPNYHEADTYMNLVCSSFLNDATLSEIESNICTFFSPDSGVIHYLKKVLMESKNTTQVKSIPACFNVIYMLYKNFPRLLEEYLDDVFTFCDVSLQTNIANKYKESAASILLMLISSDDLSLTEVQLLTLIARVKECLSRGIIPSALHARYIEIMGALSHKNLKKSCDYTNALLKYFKHLNSESSGYQVLLVGGYSALSTYMESPEFLWTENQLLCFYNSMKRDITYPKTDHKQGSYRCLTFFTKHLDQFGALLVSHVEEWVELLEVWLLAEPKRDSEGGFNALLALYQLVAGVWVTDVAPEYFHTSVAKFRNALHLKSDDKHTHLATRVLGIFAPICMKNMEGEEVMDLFTHIIQYVEHHLLTHKCDSLSNNIADYIEAVSNFTKAMPSSRLQYLNLFKSITIVVIKKFPNVMTNRREMVINTLFVILSCIKASSLARFDEFVDDVIKQGQLWTCSHGLAQHVEMLDISGVTYKSYLPLWFSLLQNQSDVEKREISNLVANKLCKYLIYSVDKLNFNLTDIGAGTTFEDYEPEKEHDFLIFANLADFYCDIFDDNFPTDVYKSWIKALLSYLIKKSLKHPLVSGFYKLMGVCLKVSDKIGFFTAERIKTKEHVALTCEDVKNYIECVIRKTHQYDNDLQSATSNVLLQTPTVIVPTINHDFSELIIAILKNGHTNCRLVINALDTLEKWYNDLDASISMPIIKKSMPYLDGYLRDYYVLGDNYSVESRKVKKYKDHRIELEQEPEFKQLQERILQFIAVLPSDVCLELVTSKKLNLHWINRSLLKVTLPFVESSADLYLDIFVDRVIELCLECSDRKIRVTASELLHSTMAVFLGISRVDKSPDLDKLFEKLLPPVLQLSCDVDKTITDIFDPLIKQMSHWYAHPMQIGAIHAKIFIQILLDGVSNIYGSAVRIQSGKLLFEFISWTRKQNTNSSLKNNLNNVRIIFDNLVDFAVHSDFAKRYGSVFMFRNIYKELISEEIFVDQFILNMLYGYVTSLSIEEAHDVNGDLLEEIHFCVTKVIDCIWQYEAMLKIANDRMAPPNFKDNTLNGVVYFIFNHTWHTNIHCRNACIALFKKFSPVIKSQLFVSYSWCSFIAPSQIRDISTDEILKFFSQLLCCIDGYLLYTYMGSYVDITELTWSWALNVYLEDLQCRNFEEVHDFYNIPTNTITRKQKANFEFLRMELVNRILDLMKVILNRFYLNLVTHNMLLFFRNYLFNRTTLGVVRDDPEEWNNRVSELLKLYVDNLKPSDTLFSMICRDYIISKQLTNCTLDMNLLISHRHLISGLIQLQQTALDNTVKVSTIMFKPISEFKDILDNDINTENNSIPTISDTVKEYFSLKLELALDPTNSRIDEEYTDLVSHLCRDTMIYSHQHSLKMEVGYYIFTTFKETILRCSILSNRTYNIIDHFFTNMPANMAIKYYKEFRLYFQKADLPELDNLSLDMDMTLITTKLWSVAQGSLDCEEIIDLIKETLIFMNVETKMMRVSELTDFFHSSKPTEAQQLQHLCEVVMVLGMIAPGGVNAVVTEILKKLINDNFAIIQNNFHKIAVTLLINNLFEATFYSYSLSCFLAAVHLYSVVESNVTLDDEFYCNIMKRIPNEMQDDLLNELLVLTTDFELEAAIEITQIICNLLERSSYDIFENFFQLRIISILASFNANSIEAKLIGCIYLKTLFTLINMSNIDNKSCLITEAAFSNVETGRELLQQVATILFNVCKEEATYIDYEPELYRKYQCHAYNALISFVCNAAKGKHMYYQRLFMRKDAEGNDILWTRIVPLNNEYNFMLTCDRIPSKKKLLTQVRSEKGEVKFNDNYIQSQTLFLSSLADNITNYDFAGMFVRSETQVYNKKNLIEIEIYQEDINEHECMAQLCAAMKHMYDIKMTWVDAELEWFHDIANILMNENSHPNICFFLCKVVENSKEYMSEYSRVLVPGIIKTITRHCMNLNSFACDMIIMLVSDWTNYTPSPEVAGELIEFIMKHLWIERNDIFRYYVSILKLTVERYSNFKVPYDLIDSLFKSDHQSKENLAGIHVVNILLINDIPPYENKIRTLSESLLNALNSDDKKIYSAAAETIGIFINVLQDRKYERVDKFKTLLLEKIETLIKQNDKNKFAHVVEGIANHNYKCMESYIPRIVLLMKAISAENCKVLYLKIFIKCYRLLWDQNMVRKLNIGTLLHSPNLEIQIVTLQLILKLVGFLDIKDLHHIIKQIQIINNKNPVFRSIFADVLIGAHESRSHLLNMPTTQALSTMSLMLVEMFNDPELEIREKVCAFWRTNCTIDNRLCKLIEHLFGKYYDISNESIYLSFIDFIIFQNVTNTSNPLFEHPLHTCNYNAHDVSGHWRDQYASMLPLYTSSCSIQQEWYVRATQSYKEIDPISSLASQKESYLGVDTALDFRAPLPSSITQEHRLSKMRFHQERKDVSKMHATREMKKTDSIAEMRKLATKQRHATARIYRKYRIGDFPDIQIKLDAIVNPLQELCKVDSQTALLAYKAIFDVAFKSCKTVTFWDKVQCIIDNIFKCSTSYNAILMRCLLHISYDYRRYLQFDTDLIATVARKSGNYSLGCMIIEHYLLQKDLYPTSPKRGVAAALDDETNTWLKLAELYKGLCNWDVVLGIFKDKISCSPEAQTAIRAESENRWIAARNLYKNLLATDYNVHFKEFYCDSYFKCAEELSEWHLIRTYCAEIDEGHEAATSNLLCRLASTEWRKKTLLPYYVKSCIHNDELLEVENEFKEAMKDIAIKDYLQEEFAQELCLFYLSIMRIQMSKGYAEQHSKHFLRDWKFAQPTYTFLKRQLLLHVKSSLEILKLVTLYEKINKDTGDEVINGILRILYKPSTTNIRDLLSYQELRYKYTQSFNSLLNVKLPTLELDYLKQQDILDNMKELLHANDLNLVKEALRYKNLYIVHKYFDPSDTSNLSKVERLLYFSKAALIRAEASNGDVGLYIRAFDSYLKCARDPNFNSDGELALTTSSHLMKLCRAIFEASEKYNFNINDFSSVFNTTMDDFHYFTDHGFDTLRQILTTFMECPQNKDSEVIGEACFEFAKTAKDRGTGYEYLFVEYILRSMRYGNEQALLYFPQLLSVECFEVFGGIFMTQSSQVPVWMFIRWIPNLLACIDTHKEIFVKNIIFNIARDYPNAIVYAYNLSKEIYSYENIETRNTLDELLLNPVIEKMLAAMDYVCSPATQLNMILNKLKQAANTNEATFRIAGKKFMDTLFSSEDKVVTIDSVWGNMFKNVERQKKNILEIINFTPFYKDEILKLIGKITECNSQNSKSLCDYSPWLKNFCASDYEYEIEIPGLYDGLSKPLPQYHPNIIKFLPDVSVIHSKQMPIALSIVASNLKTYRFLVKCGEDLRQDHRIQQIFKLMNLIMDSDVKCHDEKYTINTFEIIPLSLGLGLIKWVDETETLLNLVRNRNGLPVYNQLLVDAANYHKEWISQSGGYSCAVTHHSKEVATANYEKIVAIVPWDLLSVSLWNVASDPDTYFALRQNFIQSYAIMCCCNWLVGIGDRHLENILINMNSGEVLGIDFACAFGAGVQHQIIPELVPFRLTPQFVNLMAPLRESGGFEKTLVHVLRALRSKSEELLATMSVFVNEPTINWVERCQSWEPNFVIDNVKDKLSGMHSAVIMIREVNARTCGTEAANTKYLQFLQEFLTSNGYNNPDRLLGVNEQSRCLIAHATESNFLGRLFHGWQPWL